MIKLNTIKNRRMQAIIIVLHGLPSLPPHSLSTLIDYSLINYALIHPWYNNPITHFQEEKSCPTCLFPARLTWTRRY